MKRQILFVAILLLPFGAIYGQNAFREVSESCCKQEQFFVSELSKRTLNLYLKKQLTSSEIKEVVENIDCLKVLSFSTKNQNDIKTFLQDVDLQFGLKNYTPLKVKSTGYGHQMVYLKEKNEQIKELLVINTNLSQVSLVEIGGDIDLEKIALLNSALNINGLETLDGLNENSKKPGSVVPLKKKKHALTHPKKKYASSKKFQPWLIDSNNFYSNDLRKGIKVYNKSGNILMDTRTEPLLMVNGYQSDDLQASLANINPNCIQSINVIKEDTGVNPHGLIDVMLKGDVSEIFMVCDGMLYFGQNGYIQSIKIDDDCSPSLLHNCHKKPLSEILQLEPNQLKSIELTSDPRNCEGLLEGEFVVIESK